MNMQISSFLRFAAQIKHWSEAGAYYPARTAPILSLYYGVFIDRSIFRYENLNPVHMRILQSLRLVSKAPAED